MNSASGFAHCLCVRSRMTSELGAHVNPQESNPHTSPRLMEKLATLAFLSPSRSTFFTPSTPMWNAIKRFFWMFMILKDAPILNALHCTLSLHHKTALIRKDAMHSTSARSKISKAHYEPESLYSNQLFPLFLKLVLHFDLRIYPCNIIILACSVQRASAPVPHGLVLGLTNHRSQLHLACDAPPSWYFIILTSISNILCL